MEFELQNELLNLICCLINFGGKYSSEWGLYVNNNFYDYIKMDDIFCHCQISNEKIIEIVLEFSSKFFNKKINLIPNYEFEISNWRNRYPCYANKQYGKSHI